MASSDEHIIKCSILWTRINSQGVYFLIMKSGFFKPFEIRPMNYLHSPRNNFEVSHLKEKHRKIKCMSH